MFTVYSPPSFGTLISVALSVGGLLGSEISFPAMPSPSQSKKYSKGKTFTVCPSSSKRFFTLSSIFLKSFRRLFRSLFIWSLVSTEKAPISPNSLLNLARYSVTCASLRFERIIDEIAMRAAASSVPEAIL